MNRRYGRQRGGFDVASCRSPRFRLLLGDSLAAVIGLVVSGSAWVFGSVMRHGHPERASLGRLDGEYVRRECVLERRLGCSVKITKIAEIPVFQAMADGKVDAVLEDWNHVDQYKQSSTKQKRSSWSAQTALDRPYRLVRPEVPAQAVPAVQDLAGSKGKERCSRPRSPAHRGCSLAATLIRPEGHGADRAARARLQARDGRCGARRGGRFTQQIKQTQARHFLWWTPQYLNPQLDLAEVELPARIKACQDDASAGGDVKNTSALTRRSARTSCSARSSSRAALPQSRCSGTSSGRTPTRTSSRSGSPGDNEAEKAAEKWVKANAAKVNAWLKSRLRRRRGRRRPPPVRR